MDESLALTDTTAAGGLEVRVNFGVLAGRHATPAELELLGRTLLEDVGAVSLVSEERIELSSDSEAEVHQVRIEVEGAALDEALRHRVVETAERWARACAADRRADVTDI
jgi:hypothetical protein